MHCFVRLSVTTAVHTRAEPDENCIGALGQQAAPTGESAPGNDHAGERKGALSSQGRGGRQHAAVAAIHSRYVHEVQYLVIILIAIVIIYLYASKVVR